MRAAASLHRFRVACAVVAVFVAAQSVPLCIGRPWDRQRPPHEPTTVQTTVCTTCYDAEYDAESEAAADDEPSASASEHSLDYGREPAERDYGEPERTHEEPERDYGEPERDYGEPERAHAEPERAYEEPEQNYEVDEEASVLSDGRVHGVRQRPDAATTATSTAVRVDGDAPDTPQTPRKSGYVVDGKHYRKYRVEEETPDGFIVGEYGVVSHRDGTTRGVRYTADSSINPRVIYEALAKFLNLKRRR